MIYTIPYNSTTIRFWEEGNGSPVVLLHGYLESLDVWDEFASELAKDFRVIAIDLLGHGKTGNIAPVHTMEMMADAVNAVIEHLKIDKFTIVGHSMGGYVALEYLSKYPKKLNGLVLFHSTPMADNETRKAARELAIQDIKAGKKVQIAKEHIQKTFAPENYNKLTQDIGFLKIVAINTSNEGIIAALEGMKERKDHRETLKNAKIPILIILGAKDQFIPKDLDKLIELPENSEILYLENSGHQGYIEEREKSLKKLKEFIKKCNA